MSQFTRAIIRVPLYSSRTGVPFTAQDTGSTPVLYKGVGVDFQFAFFADEENLFEVANIFDITLMVKPANNPGASPLILKTIAGNTLNNALTIAQWRANQGQHATVTLLGSETSIAEGVHDLTIWGHTGDAQADADIFGISSLRVIDRGITAITNPGVNPSYPTLDQLSAMLAGFVPYVLPPGGAIVIPSRNGAKQVKLSCDDEGNLQTQTQVMT